MADIDYSLLRELVVKYQNGDGKAFEEIYNMTYQTAKFTAMKILNNNESDADDVLQDCYIKVMGKINTLKEPSSFMSWFNMMVANRAKTLIRKNNPHFYEKDNNEDYSNIDSEWTEEFGEDNNDLYFDNTGDDGYTIGESKKQAFIDEASSEDYEELLPGSDIEKEELRNTVMNMIEDLSDEKKTAVILYYYNNLTTREISESIGVSENTIKSRLVQAKKDIAKSVSAYESKNGKLLGVTPATLVTWALKSSAASTSIVPYVASGLAAAGAGAATVSGAAAATGTGIVAKIIAGVVIVGIIAGGGIAEKKANKNHTDEQEEAITASVEEHTETDNKPVEENDDRQITSRPTEEYTVADNKITDTYFETERLKYGVDSYAQVYVNRDGSIYRAKPVLNRKNFKASYEELLTSAKENREKYSKYISDSVSAINGKRAASGKSTLEFDDALTEQANVRAEEIAWTERDTAVRFDGTSYTTLFDLNGYSTGSRCEIRRVDYSSYNKAIDAILKDEKINGDFEKIGVGVAENPENGKLVFVVHLYSSKDGKTDENISVQDKLIAWQNDMIDDIVDRLTDTSLLDELERRGKEIPIIKDLLEYDFHNDLILEYLNKLVDSIPD